MEEFIKVSDYATMTGVTPQAIYQSISAGRLESKIEYGITLVKVETAPSPLLDRLDRESDKLSEVDKVKFWRSQFEFYMESSDRKLKKREKELTAQVEMLKRQIR